MMSSPPSNINHSSKSSLSHSYPIVSSRSLTALGPDLSSLLSNLFYHLDLDQNIPQINTICERIENQLNNLSSELQHNAQSFILEHGLYLKIFTNFRSFLPPKHSNHLIYYYRLFKILSLLCWKHHSMQNELVKNLTINQYIYIFKEITSSNLFQSSNPPISLTKFRTHFLRFIWNLVHNNPDNIYALFIIDNFLQEFVYPYFQKEDQDLSTVCFGLLSSLFSSYQRNIDIIINKGFIVTIKMEDLVQLRDKKIQYFFSSGYFTILFSLFRSKVINLNFIAADFLSNLCSCFSPYVSTELSQQFASSLLSNRLVDILVKNITHDDFGKFPSGLIEQYLYCFHNILLYPSVAEYIAMVRINQKPEEPQISLSIYILQKFLDLFIKCEPNIEIQLIFCIRNICQNDQIINYFVNLDPNPFNELFRHVQAHTSILYQYSSHSHKKKSSDEASILPIPYVYTTMRALTSDIGLLSYFLKSISNNLISLSDRYSVFESVLYIISTPLKWALTLNPNSQTAFTLAVEIVIFFGILCFHNPPMQKKLIQENIFDSIIIVFILCQKKVLSARNRSEIINYNSHFIMICRSIISITQYNEEIQNYFLHRSQHSRSFVDTIYHLLFKENDKLDFRVVNILFLLLSALSLVSNEPPVLSNSSILSKQGGAHLMIKFLMDKNHSNTNSIPNTTQFIAPTSHSIPQTNVTHSTSIPNTTQFIAPTSHSIPQTNVTHSNNSSPFPPPQHPFSF